MNQSLLIYLLILSTLPVARAQECLGSEKAKHSVVYLHGMDTTSPSPQEMRNREVLNDLAQKLNLRIALPRAISICPNNQNQICWGWDFSDVSSITSSLEIVSAAAKKCFSKSNHIILLGFSNGGFVVNRLIQDCLKTPYTQFISVAAGGTWNANSTKDLSQCGSLVLLIGRKDSSNYKPVKEYHSWLKQNKAATTLIEFPGSHELPSKELEQTLQALTRAYN